MSRDFQAAIVAGGRGVRMRPATDVLPKPMLPVRGRPILEHLVEWLKRSGAAETFLCLGYRAQDIASHFGDGSRWGMRLHYQVETEPRGTAGCVRDLRDRLRGDLLVVYGDLYVEMDCGRLLDFHAGHAGAATIVARETDHPLDSDLLRTEGDRITAFYRAKAGQPHGTLGCAAMWVLRPRLLERIPADRPTDFGRDVFPEAAAAGETLMAYRTSEAVLDVGTPERIEAFERRWASRSRP
ncbi:MAG: NDP-sugar synthase [Elusimicrobia bacterium]|nr:NDP-sugar synthase [Elusimicrobiota bacterium]